MTTSSNGHGPDVIEGLVESANERGVKVGGEWRNASKFHPVNLPDRGSRVRLNLDSKGFIRDLQVLDGAPATSSPTSTMRDHTITRLGVLKAAANFVGLWGQNREDVRSDHVLVLADRWLRWVEQPEEEEASNE